MITLVKVKDYLNINETTFDDYLNTQITKCYEIFERLLGVEISATDKITQKYYRNNGYDLYTNLDIITVDSFKNSVGTDFDYENTRTKIIIDSDETLDDTDLVLIHSTNATSQIEDLALLYLVYYFSSRQDQRNNMFIQNKRSEIGIVEAYTDVMDFRNIFELQVKDILIWQQ